MASAAVNVGSRQSEVHHFVPVLRHVGGDSIVEASDIVSVADEKFPAGIVDASQVYRHGSHRAERGRRGDAG